MGRTQHCLTLWDITLRVQAPREWPNPAAADVGWPERCTLHAALRGHIQSSNQFGSQHEQALLVGATFTVRDPRKRKSGGAGVLVTSLKHSLAVNKPLRGIYLVSIPRSLVLVRGVTRPPSREGQMLACSPASGTVVSPAFVETARA